MDRFPENDIISLVEKPARYDLGESTGPDLKLAELLDADALGGLPLGYGTAAADRRRLVFSSPITSGQRAEAPQNSTKRISIAGNGVL